MGDRRLTAKTPRYFYVTCELSLDIPSWLGATSISTDWEVNGHITLCTGCLTVWTGETASVVRKNCTFWQFYCLKIKNKLVRRFRLYFCLYKRTVNTSSIAYYRPNQHSRTIFVLAVTVFLLLENNPAMMTVILSPACYFMISIDCQLQLNISQHDFAHIIVPLCGVSYLLIKRICMYVCTT